MEQENRTSQCSLQSRGGSLNKKQKRRPAAVSARPPSVLCHQSMGRFSLCFFVNSSAFFMNFARSLLYSSARSALSGCSGWGLFTRRMRLWRTWGERGHKYMLFMRNLFTFKYKQVRERHTATRNYCTFSLVIWQHLLWTVVNESVLNRLVSTSTKSTTLIMYIIHKCTKWCIHFYQYLTVLLENVFTREETLINQVYCSICSVTSVHDCSVMLW